MDWDVITGLPIYELFVKESDKDMIAFLNSVDKLAGCSVKKAGTVINGQIYFQASIDSRYTKKKQIVIKEKPVPVEKTVVKEVIKGGRPRTADPTRYTVGEVFRYCADHKQTKAAEHFGIPYRSLQRYISNAKKAGHWNDSDTSKFGDLNLS